MCAIRILLVILAAQLVPSFLQADGLIRQLPKDGTWVEYEMDANIGNGDQVRHEKGTLRIASVGQAEKDGQPCRWIEFVFATETVGEKSPGSKAETKEIMKVLIPEKYLAKGETPLDHLVEVWIGRNPGVASKVKKPGDIEDDPLPLLLAGPLKNAKSLPKEEIESKLGKKSCEGESGVLDLSSPQGSSFHFDIERQLHPDAPFGVVTEKMSGESAKTSKREKLTIKWTLKLIDFGDQATSQMPKPSDSPSIQSVLPPPSQKAPPRGQP